MLQPQQEKTLELAGLEVADFKIKTGLAKFDLHLEIIESSSHGLSCALEFNTDIFAASDIQQFAKHYCNLLESLLQDIDKPIQELSLLTAAEKSLLTQWNDTREVYPRNTVYTLFRQQAQTYPDHIAIVDREQRLTYRELDRLSTELAHHLPMENAPLNPIVALLMDRSVEAIIAILAIHQCGAAYLPLDTHSPPARLQNILVNAPPVVILAQKTYLPLLKDCRNKVVAIEDLLNLGAKSNAKEFSLSVQPRIIIRPPLFTPPVQLAYPKVLSILTQDYLTVSNGCNNSTDFLNWIECYIKRR